MSKLSLRNLSLHNFWTKQIKGTLKSRLKLDPESTCESKERSCFCINPGTFVLPFFGCQLLSTPWSLDFYFAALFSLFIMLLLLLLFKSSPNPVSHRIASVFFHNSISSQYSISYMGFLKLFFPSLIPRLHH